jgi:hypothetical protein
MRIAGRHLLPVRIALKGRSSQGALPFCFFDAFFRLFFLLRLACRRSRSNRMRPAWRRILPRLAALA